MIPENGEKISAFNIYIDAVTRGIPSLLCTPRENIKNN